MGTIPWPPTNPPKPPVIDIDGVLHKIGRIPILRSDCVKTCSPPIYVYSPVEQMAWWMKDAASAMKKMRLRPSEDRTAEIDALLERIKPFAGQGSDSNWIMHNTEPNAGGLGKDVKGD